MTDTERVIYLENINFEIVPYEKINSLYDK